MSFVCYLFFFLRENLKRIVEIFIIMSIHVKIVANSPDYGPNTGFTDRMATNQNAGFFK